LAGYHFRYIGGHAFYVGTGYYQQNVAATPFKTTGKIAVGLYAIGKNR